MRKLLAIVMLFAAAFAANMPDTAGPAATSAVMVQTNNAGEAQQISVMLSAGSISANGVTAQTQEQVRERNGSLYMITNAGAEKQINWTPDAVKTKLQEQGIFPMDDMELAMDGENPVYLINSIQNLETGEQPIGLKMETEFNAETGENTVKSAVINSQNGQTIRIRTQVMEIMMDPVQAQIHLDGTLANENPTIEATQERLRLHIENGELVMTQNQTQTRTQEKVQLKDGRMTVGDKPVSVMPEQARASVSERAQIREMALEEVENRVQYRINAMEQKRFLGLFDVDIDTETTVDAETGIAQTRGAPWWGFLAF